VEDFSSSSTVVEVVQMPWFLKASKFCNGLCPRIENAKPVPNALCISACKDSQTILETGEGKSVTSIIIDYLEKEPNPTLKSFMRAISNGFHALGKQIEQERIAYLRELKRYEELLTAHSSVSSWSTYFENKRRESGDPQLSSLQPLIMDSRLML